MTPAEAVTQNFQWTGSTGYSVRGTFSYDETTATKIISEKGAGQTNNLKSLTVTFYTPSGEPIHGAYKPRPSRAGTAPYQYENVVDGKSQGNYFEFNFAPTTKQLFGSIDLGGEQSGELFLKGTVERELSLIEIEPSGDEHLLDSDR